MKRVVAITLLSLVAFACGNSGSPVLVPQTVDGEELFGLKAVGSTPGCVTCHSLVPDQVLVGPSLAGLAERADETYIRTSIIDPTAYLGDRSYATPMPEVFGELLADEQIDALVEYLLGAT